MNALLAETKTILGDMYDIEPELYWSEVPTASGPVPVHDLWQRFNDSPYGQHMGTQPLRYAQSYGHDPELMVRNLGADVLPLLHQYETGLYGAGMIKAERSEGTIYSMDDENAAITLFALSIHDMGETTHEAVREAVGATVGDIEYGRKTPEDRRIEANVRKFLYATVFPDVDKPVLDEAEAIIAHQDNGLRHEVFEASHDLQSVVTAARARIAFERGLSGLLVAANPDHHHDEALALRKLHNLYVAVNTSYSEHMERSAAQFGFTRKALPMIRRAIAEAGAQTDVHYDAYRRALNG
ncbi:MAG TPA: hypothetical protein VN031_01820 [Candidatus Microsaccharimonas sp.]|nr:hypothetical protein [Candidatus Microsaccharimonas sp.]